jgi:hypothetical protein
MKLTYFSEQTYPKQTGRGGKLPKITFGKTGIITFNREACKLAGLTSKDKVTIAQDEEEPENWYFFKDPQHGFELRPAYEGKSAQFNHVTLSKAFLEAMGKDLAVTHNLKIAGKPTVMKGSKTEYWGILIS